MNKRELSHILIAILILAIVISFYPIVTEDWALASKSLVFAIIIVLVNVGAKKIRARSLDSDVEHEIWTWQRYGFKKHSHFKTPVSAGAIFPLVFSFFSLGILKIPAILTYETRALKRRAAKRFGFYSFSAMTDKHNSLIGAAGIIALLLLTVIAYFLPFQDIEYLAKMSTYYAMVNLLPISKLDGTQIFFGSRVLYTSLLIITLIFTAYALILV